MFRKKADKVYRYTFHSNEFDVNDIEQFLKYEIMPTNNSNYRSDWDDFSINGRCIAFGKNSVWIASKCRLMGALQTRLDMLSTVKKHNRLLN